MYYDSNFSEKVQQKVTFFALLLVIFCLVLYTFIHDGCTRNGCTFAFDKTALDEKDLKTLTDQELTLALHYRKMRISNEQNSSTIHKPINMLIWQDVKKAKHDIAEKEINAEIDENQQQKQIDNQLKN